MDQTLKQHPELLFVLIPAFWSGIIFLIAHVSGWSRLASEYGSLNPWDGRQWRFQSAQIGWSNYGGCLTVGVNPLALYLSVLFPFRPGHPPLQIPWEDVSVSEGRSFFMRFVDLRFSRAASVRVRVPKALADKIQNEMGTRWPRGVTLHE